METKPTNYSSTEIVALPNLVRPSHEPDVPQDVDFIMEHLNDPNFDLNEGVPRSASSRDSFELDRKSHAASTTDFSTRASDIDTESQLGSTRYSRTQSPEGEEFDDESPYLEVRASVSSVDDPSMPVSTFRMWFLGLAYSILIAGLNQLFSMRFPAVFITGLVAQLTALPLGKLLEYILPTTRFNTFGYVWSFNPGPFNIKEHVCITVMANVVVGGAYAIDILATQKAFYNQQLTFGYEILLLLSTQIIGFSFSGVLRQFIVWPSSMIWPGALVNSALFNTLHRNFGRPEKRHISREKFFLFALICSFVWYWIPGYLFTALSVFNWVCWIAPQNIPVNALFGTLSGLGMGIFTFDWAMISYIGSPLVTPWWSEANTGIALVLFFWIISPIMYFTNTWFAKFLPISATTSFDNTGMPYSAAAITTNNEFDVAKYRAYSPLFMPTTLAVAYGLSFASFSAVIVHTFLWFRRDIARRFNRSLKDERDVHSRLMRAYPEVPLYWYAAMGVVSLVLLLVTVEIFPTKLPIWAVFFALLLAFGLSLPLGMLQAITNQQIALEVMHELIAGYILPGRPIANMIFKCVAYIGANQAVGFSGDLKLGHYMKIPPRVMFACQVVAAIIGCFTVNLVQNWMFANIEDLCSPDQKNGFVCPSTSTFGTASIIWGGIGPKRLFSPGALYSPLLWFFLIGAVAPIPFYFLARRFPLSIWRYFNAPVFFAGVGAIPPASGINYSSWLITGFIFNFVMRRFHFRWWMRYNYILSAALDSGVALSSIVIFFALQLPKGGINVNWWGNLFWTTTADALGLPMNQIAPGGTFGPETWS